jgi:hypothetical protein
MEIWNVDIPSQYYTASRHGRPALEPLSLAKPQISRRTDVEAACHVVRQADAFLKERCFSPLL